MTSRHVVRQLVPPALAVLVSVGILLLNEEGLRSLEHPVVLALVLVLSVVCWWLFRPRPSVGRSEPRKALLIWRVVAPLIAFLSGPGTVAFLWALVVFGFEREHYVTTHERIEELMAALPVGMVVGFLASLLVFAWVASAD
jgi:hypothetical protein